MIIDILNNEQINTLDFTVDTSVNEVIAFGPVGGPDIMVARSNGSQFEDGDNIFLESIRIMPGYDFGHGTGDIQIGFDYFQNGVDKIIPEIGIDGTIWMPKPCIEQPMNIQLQAPDPGSGDYSLRLAVAFQMNVSMVCAPDSLNGENIPITVQVRTKHTRPML